MAIGWCDRKEGRSQKLLRRGSRVPVGEAEMSCFKMSDSSSSFDKEWTRDAEMQQCNKRSKCSSAPK